MALENSVVLSHLYQFLPFEDKKSFRVVTPLWEEATISDWRNNAVVKAVIATPGAGTAMYWKNTMTMADFMKILQTLPPEEGGQATSAPTNNQETYHRFPTKPFRRFKLTDKFWEWPPYKTDITFLHEIEGTEEFLEKCGSTTEYLHLQDAINIREGREADVLKWILLKSFVNLKGLPIDYQPCLDVCTDKAPNEPLLNEKDLFQLKATKLEMLNLRGCFQNKKRSISEHFFELIPNLKDLRLAYNSTSILPILSPLRHPLSNGKYIMLERLELNLRHQFFDSHIENECVQFLREYVEAAKPPLKKIMLVFNFEELWRSSANIKIILESCAKTLTWLTIHIRDPLRDAYDDDVDELRRWVTAYMSGLCLPNLTHFYLQHAIASIEEDDDDATTVENEHAWHAKFDFEVLRGFPKLRKLNILIMDGIECSDSEQESMNNQLNGNQGQEFIDPEPILLKDLEEFNYHFCGHKFDGASLEVIGKWMPSLKRLTICADDTIFPVVYDVMPKLQKLSILPSDDNQMKEENVEQENNNTETKIEVVKNDWEFHSLCEAPKDFSI